ncbi:hypothetical protein [Marisediminicola sp. LYQ134]|uniref:hypothetical protein n=1 Tax=Marisediminicola sp. LYQ134 TaxID=3391061 RepID=UPI003983B30F
MDFDTGSDEQLERVAYGRGHPPELAASGSLVAAGFADRSAEDATSEIAGNSATSVEDSFDLWFEGQQMPADELGAELPLIDPESTRALDTMDYVDEAWMAKGRGERYCLILETSEGESGYSWTCARPDAISESGLELSNSEFRIEWRAEYLSVSPAETES